MGNGNNNDSFSFYGIEHIEWKTGENLFTNAFSYGLRGERIVEYGSDSFMDFNDECDANAGRFTFVVTCGFAEFLFRFRQKFRFHFNSASARRNTSSVGIPRTTPWR